MPRIEAVRDVRAAHNALITVYVEGKLDVQVLKHRWFAEVPGAFDLDFQLAGPAGDEGGCTAVVERARAARGDRSRKVFGIVDRDALLRDGQVELFLETDDHRFTKVCPFGDGVRCLGRWAIENYLVTDPEVVEHILADLGDGAPRARREPGEVAEELLSQGDALIPIAAADVWRLAEADGSKVDNGFGTHLADRAAIEAALLEHDPGLADALPDWVPRITAFDPGPDAPSSERWERQNRVLEGKRVLRRLRSLHGIGLAFDRIAATLASKAAELGRVPRDLSALVEGIVAEAERAAQGVGADEDPGP